MAVAQLVESRIVIPVVVGSSPISHPNINADVAQLVEHLFEAQGVASSTLVVGTKQIPQWRNWKTHFFQKKDVEGSNPSWGTIVGSLIQWIEYHVPIVVIQVRFL